MKEIRIRYHYSETITWV